MGRYSAAMLAEESSPARQSRWLLDVATSTPLRFSYGTVPAPGVGNYLGRIISVDSFERVASDRDFALVEAQMSLTLDDTDGTLIRAARGPTGNAFRGTGVTLSRGTVNPALTQSDWLPVFAGVVTRYEIPEAFKFQILARVDDRRLTRSVPVPITKADWPNAQTSAVGQLAPRVYGVHDSSLSGGAIPLLLVDINAKRYVVALGWIASVDRVYVAGVAAASGWSISYVTVNGRRWTTITFTSSQGDSAVTADVHGYAANADGTGALIDNPVDQHRHFIVQWLYYDYRAQASWGPDSAAPIDSTYYTAAALYPTAHGYKNSRRIGGDSKQTGLSVSNEWTGCLKIRPFWTGGGKLALKIWDHGIANTAIYPTGQKVIGQRDTKAFAVRFDSRDLMSQVALNFGRNEVMDQYTQSLNVRDPTVPTAGVERLDVPWAYSGA